MKFNSPAGMKDILPEEALLWHLIEEKAISIFNLYGYKPLRTPILEERALFNRSLGEETEIVRKQMFEVRRGSSESYALRPEATAAVVRSYLENNLDKTDSFIKLYYIGPMFRAERPQKGRLRQFHHIGVEALGSGSPYLDSEIIALAQRILEELKVHGWTIRLNSLGCSSDRQKLKDILFVKLKSQLNKLCADCNERYKKNIFRVLDCKNEGCALVVAALQLRYEDYLCGGCSEHFLIVRENLDRLKINYSLSPTLVRGLDYYSRTVFEITHRGLGAQDAIAAGGRYDRLISDLGGPELGAAGFAFGVERLILASGLESEAAKPRLDIFMATLGNSAREQGFALLQKLREARIASETDYENKSLKGQLRKANDLAVRFVALLGDDELKKQTILLKDMRSGKQEEISLDSFVEAVKIRIQE